ncbi:MAG: hypothetical protein ACLP5H_11815 [Desulfomonilaceae bacterium]
MQVSYRSVSLAGIVTVIVVTVVTLLGESSTRFMKLLTYPTGHHWVTKNFLSVIVFLITLALASGRSPASEKSPVGSDAIALLWMGVTTVVCSAVVLGFFVMDVLKG